MHQNSLFSKSQRQINRTIGRIGSTVTIFVGTCVKEKMQVNKGTYKVKSPHLYCEMEKRIPLSIHTTSSSRMKMIFNSKWPHATIITDFSIKIFTLYYSKNNSNSQVVRIPWIVNFLPVSILNLSGVLKSTKPPPLGTRQNKLDKHTLLYHQAMAKGEVHVVLQRFWKLYKKEAIRYWIRCAATVNQFTAGC